MGNEQGFTRVGLNILFGADYYFSDAIYMGFEAGLGFSRTSFGNHSITTDNLTAFNMYFNNAFNLLKQLDLKLQASLWVNCHLVHWMVLSTMNWPDGAGSDESTTWPNHISNTTIGNVFQGALRVGFLFD